MTEIWCVVRKPEGDESPYVGPFTSREDAQAWADRQIQAGRDVIDVRRLDVPVGPPDD
jgi:hypothetical protein